MEVDDERNAMLNVAGTQNAIDLANEIGAGTFHHASSIAVAGDYEGFFTEDMFDEGQKLPHPYHRTKFEAEKLVRKQVHGRRGASTGRRSSSATRRPARWTRSTGPTTSSRRSRRSRAALPQWFPLVGLEVGHTNLVPVDYVAAAMDHIAHQEGLDGRAFHLVSPSASGPARSSTRSRAPATRRRWSCGSTSG